MFYRSKSRKATTAPKPRKESRVGKTGTVRHYGEDMSKQRDAAYLRDHGRCQLRLVCQGQYVPYKDCHLAHLRTKRNHGDALENLVIACPACHIQSHAYGPSGMKPCPPKASEV